jgi:putative SOS response-associated peptidase YedK
MQIVQKRACRKLGTLLDPGMKDVSAVSELLRPYDARLMRCYPVSSRINSAVNDDEECSRRVEPAVVQNHLFS